MAKKTENNWRGSGRNPIFENGATPFQELIALLLALGKKPYDVCRSKGISYEAVRQWLKYPYYQKLVEDYKQQFIKGIQDKGFDDTQFLTDTMVESLKSPAHRSDGLRARELMAKIRGEFSPEEMNLKISKELEKLSDEDLIKLATEAANKDATDTIPVNRGGTSTP